MPHHNFSPVVLASILVGLWGGLGAPSVQHGCSPPEQLRVQPSHEVEQIPLQGAGRVHSPGKALCRRALLREAFSRDGLSIALLLVASIAVKLLGVKPTGSQR